jgi:ATP synthase protein I
MAMTLQNSKKDNILPFLRYSSVGLEMGLCVVIGITSGYYLDKYFSTSPYLTILFMLFGIGAAIKTILRLIKQVAKDDERNNDK